MTTIRNVLIIGSGPAAHTAAIYLARANLAPLLLEGDSAGEIVAGGLLTTTKVVENFPGFPKGINGYDLTENFREHSLRFGTEIRSETVTEILPKEDTTFEVRTAEGSYVTKRVLIATGSTPNGLDIPGYKEFWHKGISTCAVCDGGLPVFRGVPLAVIGGGDSACEEALHLSHTASKVYLVHRRGELRASKIMADRVRANPKIEILWNRNTLAIEGGQHVEAVQLVDNVTKEIQRLPVRGVFVAIGHTPNTEFVKGLVELDGAGYIVTSRAMETSQKGIWAAGDVQDPHYRQAITAAGSGCIAALEMERSLH